MPKIYPLSQRNATNKINTIEIYFYILKGLRNVKLYDVITLDYRVEVCYSYKKKKE